MDRPASSESTGPSPELAPVTNSATPSAAGASSAPATTSHHDSITPNTSNNNDSDAVATPTGPAIAAVDAAPTPSSTSAMARFEFEANRGKEGTKVLLVEWDSESPEDPLADKCEVDWEGKTKVLPVIDRDTTTKSIPAGRRRMCFLLPPGASIPPTVTIKRPGLTPIHTNVLPAIFAPGLGPNVPDPGRRGVLHTLWANIRMAGLTQEMSAEMKQNGEGVALDMVLAEKEWVVEYFGLSQDTEGERPNKPALAVNDNPPPMMVGADARSPMNPRLAERLKGLKLATSPEGLAAVMPESKTPSYTVSSALVGAVFEPESTVPGLIPMGGVSAPGGDDEADELFALPMSPRSPEMKRSPFSIL